MLVLVRLLLTAAVVLQCTVPVYSTVVTLMCTACRCTLADAFSTVESALLDQHADDDNSEVDESKAVPISTGPQQQQRVRRRGSQDNRDAEAEADEGLTDADTAGAAKRKSMTIQFDSAHVDESDDGNNGKAPGRASSKVYPMDQHSAASSTQSKSSVAMFHKAMENNKLFEEHSLVLLRRLLRVVSLVVAGLSMGAMALSKSVVSEGVANVVVTALEGERQTYQQVRDDCSGWKGCVLMSC